MTYALAQTTCYLLLYHANNQLRSLMQHSLQAANKPDRWIKQTSIIPVWTLMAKYHERDATAAVHRCVQMAERAQCQQIQCSLETKHRHKSVAKSAPLIIVT